MGWTAAWRGHPPRCPGLPRAGLFARCRQPNYLGFALVLWTTPAWTPDRVAVALAWTAYCIVGPIHKERRFAATFGREFEEYRRRTPYLVPRIFS
jgi:protein-S-isoprenylcysteine O-methyltransferase Ste14